jgi:hypothetical protein
MFAHLICSILIWEYYERDLGSYLYPTKQIMGQPTARDSFQDLIIHTYLNTTQSEQASQQKCKPFIKLSLYLTKHHAMKTYWGSGGIAPCILDLGTRWRWVVSFTPWPICPWGKSPWYPLDRRLGGPQSHSGHSGEKKNSQPQLGIKP